MTGHAVLEYDSPHPLYGLAFSSNAHQQRLALTTLITGPSNKLSIIELDPSFASSSRYGRSSPHDDYSSFSRSSNANPYRQIAQANLPFPASKVAFEPATYAASAGAVGPGGYAHGDGDERGGLVATSGDVLRIWDLKREWNDGYQQGQGQNGAMGNGGFVGRSGNGYAGQGAEWMLETRSVLTSSKSPSLSLPPITSFAWNSISPERIVSCSIDTTATLWDIETTKAVTQLIAHDRAVYDLSWLPASSDIFVSVGADGSLRAFDLRQLEHSTILYESANDVPLARIAFSNTEQHMLACFGVDDSKVLILDMRSPGVPVAELVGHQGPLSAIAWGSGGSGGSGGSDTGGGWIASCADDGQLLMYDLVTPLPESRPPSTAPSNGPGAGGGGKSGRSGGNANARSGTGTAKQGGASSSTNTAAGTTRGDRRLGAGSASPYPHSLKPRPLRGPGPNDPDYDGYSSPLMGGSSGGKAKTPVDPLMLGVSSGVPGAGGGIGAGSGTGRTPSPGRTASTGTEARDDKSTVSANGGGASGSTASSAISIMPARAWSSPQGREISNLAFDAEGEWVGCVAGSRLSVLKF